MVASATEHRSEKAAYWAEHFEAWRGETDAQQILIKPCKSMQLAYILSIEFDGGEHERTHFFQARHC